MAQVGEVRGQPEYKLFAGLAVTSPLVAVVKSPGCLFG